MWTPVDIEKTQMYEFLVHVNTKHDLKIASYDELHAWSVDQNEKFWGELLDFSGIKYSGIKYSGNITPACLKQSFIDYPWFPHVKLNFAENLLKNGKEDALSLVGLHESMDKKSLSFAELRSKVSKLQQYLLNSGFQVGDVLACYMPNCIETVVSMLACTSLGGTFTSTSPDFGLDGVIDRFGQSKPKFLVMSLNYSYNEKKIELNDRVEKIQNSIPSIEKIIGFDYLGFKNFTFSGKVIPWEETQSLEAKDLTFKEVPFNHPLYIMYSSGTTGKPKCIVHSTGGTLLQHVKELVLHTDLKAGEKILYFTTCGWMMWNWLVSSLYTGATTYLFEGSPAYPSLKSFTDKLIDEKINVFGTSPKFLKSLEVYGWEKTREFESLRSILSTGAPLLEEQFDFVDNKIKKGVQLSSICGGTDIISCFMLGTPMKEVRRGELQCLGLGMDVSSFDSEGNEVFDTEGELVCRKPFVSQPLYFLNDKDNERRKSAYFNKYEDTWHHGDFVTLTQRKTIKVMGRSDATLNPGGVRIGTGEIYQQVEKFPFIKDSVCIGRAKSGDTEVVLFVKLQAGATLSDDQKKQIKALIKKEATPRHVPKVIYQVSDIPYTRSGKKMEILVSRLINGKKPDNLEAVSNPLALNDFERHANESL